MSRCRNRACAPCVQERELIMRNALSKGKERYLQLQSRLTRIETSMYSGGRRR